MTLITEILLLWSLVLHLNLSLIAQVIVVILFILGRSGFVSFPYGGNKVFRL